MLIDWIDSDTARALLTSLQATSSAQRESLYFRTPECALPLDIDGLVRQIYPFLNAVNGTVYQFDDGELIISWDKSEEETFADMRAALRELFDLSPASNAITRHDHASDAGVLRRVALAKAPELTGEFAQQAAAPKAPTGRIPLLLVDHDEYARKVITAALSRDYELLYTHDPMRALHLYEEHAPQLVFIEIELPQEGGGHALAASIRKQDAQAAIVLVSSQQDEADLRAALDIGAQGFIVKPYTKQKLENSLKKRFGERKD